MAVKAKLARNKRANQKRNKLSKPSVAKKGKGKPNKVVKKKQPAQNVQKTPKKTNNDPVASEESDINEDDMLDMVDEDDLEFIKSAISSKSYRFLDKIQYTEAPRKKRRKLNNTNDENDLEEQYEQNLDVDTVKLKPLLPIKTKQGVIPQSTVAEEKDVSEDEEQFASDDDSEEEEEAENEISFVDDAKAGKPVSTAELLVKRHEILRQKKIEIGSLSAGLLESPEDKVSNFRNLLNIIDEEIEGVHFTVKKLAVVALLEVFKDILPSYQLKPEIVQGVKLKKDTLKLHKYEENLMLYYKKYLQKLERLSNILIKKKGDQRQRSEEEIKLGELGVNCMCELLVTHPYFNYSQNLAQALVPFLNHKNSTVRENVKTTCETVFAEDKKGEITLKILRILNQYLKNHSHNVRVEMLQILLALRIKDVNLDLEKERELKEKKLQAQKQNVLQLSKRERKRKKRLQELEKELLETKAEESKQTKSQNLTEITKIVFGIYFRVLKSSSNTKVLGVCLEGLAKYAHCINLEYYIDLVNVLDGLLKEDWLGYREKLHCIQTVFSILVGQGEALNLDPTRFYTALYKDMFTVHASKNHHNFEILLRTLVMALIKRHKKITGKRMIGFAKRLSTLSLQLLHNSSLSCLCLVKSILQTNKSVDVLLDLDTSVGDGKFQPELDDPEYCNAATSALFEMILLCRHFHPIVSKYALHVASGVPATGNGSLAPEISKCSAEQLYSDYDMSEMAFNPAVPLPKKTQPKRKPGRFLFKDEAFEAECKNVLRNSRVNCKGFLCTPLKL